MTSKLTLKKPIWDTAKRRQALSKVILAAGFEFEGDVKDYITNSTPAGRTYRRGAITRSASSKTDALGLKTFSTAAGNSRAIVGFNFHRASAPGQPPAIDTGNLRNSIRSRQLSQLRVRVSVGAAYGARLDSERGLNRPFFQVVFRKQRDKYLARIRREMNRLT